MDITQSARSVVLQHRLQDFMAAHLYPVERELYLAAERLGPWAIYPHIEDLKARYGFDQPMPIRYLHWVGGMLQGDFGYSFEYRLPVNEVVGDRLWLTVLLSSVTILFTWLVAFPIGIYSATHQYSWGDYGLTFLGLLGIAIPNFMLALILMYFANVWFGVSIGHLMDREFLGQPMSWEKARSILSHLWIPVLIIGTAGTASGMPENCSAIEATNGANSGEWNPERNGSSCARTLMATRLPMSTFSASWTVAMPPRPISRVTRYFPARTVPTGIFVLFGRAIG